MKKIIKRQKKRHAEKNGKGKNLWALSWGKRVYSAWERFVEKVVLTRSSAISEGPRDASCQLKSCQLPRNSAETTCTTSPEPSISCR